EMLSAFALLITVASAWIMQAAGLSSAMGGFIGGLLLGSSGFRHQLEAELSGIKQLLLGLFFVTVGMSIDMKLVMSQPLTVLGVLVLLLLLKTMILVLLGFVMRLKGLANKVKFAVSLSQGGEFAFVVFSLAKSQGVLPADWSAILTVAVACSMGTTPILMGVAEKWLQARAQRLEKEPEDDRQALAEAPNLSVIIAGYGDFGAIVARMLLAMGIQPTIIDNDPDRIRQAKLFGTKVYYGNAEQLALLKAAGAEEAKILVVSVGRSESAERIADIAHEAFPNLHIITEIGQVEKQVSLLTKPVEPYIGSFDPAIRAGRSCLVRLGVLSPYEAREVGDIFRRLSIRTLHDMVKAGGDSEASIAAFRTNDETLDSVMQEIRTFRRERLATVRSRSLHMKAEREDERSPLDIGESPRERKDEAAPADPRPEETARDEKQLEKTESMRADAFAAWPPLREKGITTESTAPEPSATGENTGSGKGVSHEAETQAPSAKNPVPPSAGAESAKVREEALEAIEREAESAPPPSPEDLPVDEYFKLYGSGKKEKTSSLQDELQDREKE
ncbi:MAG: cation:proton antiporter, partial [Sutterellaceae bacterium]|nr:cation:proton antiporter [Sutterellaceae bacterium]